MIGPLDCIGEPRAPALLLSEPIKSELVDAFSSATAADRIVPVEQYVAGLSRKRMAAGILFRDALGRVLLVEPSYKPNWEIPGGVVEADESPWAAATRELAEDLGWDRAVRARTQNLLICDTTTGRAPTSSVPK